MEKIKKRTLLLILALLIYCSLPLRAEWITIKISGQVNYVNDTGELENKFHLGDPVSGTYTFNSAISNSDGQYYYAPPAGISLEVGSFSFIADLTNVLFTIGVINDDWDGDGYIWHSYNNLPFNSTPVDTITWWLHDSTGTALSSDFFPLTAPDLTKWDINMLDIQVGKSLIRSQITSAEIIPEPATVFLLSLGLILTRKRFSN